MRDRSQRPRRALPIGWKIQLLILLPALVAAIVIGQLASTSLRSARAVILAHEWQRHSLAMADVVVHADGFLRCVERVVGAHDVDADRCRPFALALKAGTRELLELASGFPGELEEEQRFVAAVQSLAQAGEVALASGAVADLDRARAVLHGDVLPAAMERLDEEKAGAKRAAAQVERIARWSVPFAVTVVLLALFAATLTGALMARRLAGALRALHRRVDAVAEGALEGTLDEGANDELGAVARAFNTMSRRLVESLLTRAELERQVAGRTAALRAQSEEAERNLEKLQQAQEQLATAHQLASVGTLAAGVAHEINNPLSYILTNLNFAMEQLAPLALEGAVRSREALHDAVEGAERVRDIVRDLRTFARAEVTPSERVDVIAALELALHMAENEVRHRASIARDLQPVPLVVGNAGRLSQVFLNLLINAAHAIAPGHAAHNRVTVRTHRGAAGEAIIEVSDTGCGIGGAARPYIFDPFFTTKPIGEGMGLGLSVSRSLVTAMGGVLEVAETSSAGTTMRVVLPVPDAVAAETVVPKGLDAQPPDGSAPRARLPTLLVVDDDPLVLRAVQRLAARAFQVEALSDPLEVLKRVDAGARWDAVMCDLMMPRMSGQELCAELARRAPELLARVVIVTGGAFTSEARTFVEEHRHRVVQKPFDNAVLLAALHEAVERASGGGRGE